MMSQSNKRCIYNKSHLLTIVEKNKGQIFEKTLNLNINNCDESLVSNISKIYLVGNIYIVLAYKN